MYPALRMALLGVVFYSSLAFGQSSSKPNIAFQQFQTQHAWQAQQYSHTLYEATLSNLVNSGKLNIINRSPEMWRTIENELALQDFIEPTQAIDLGKMSGAKYYLAGEIVRFGSEEKTRPNSPGEIHYSCFIMATLKLVNLELGQYEQSVQTELSAEDATNEGAIQKAIEIAARDLSEKVEALFPVLARVEKQTGSNLVMINKGFTDGVREQDVFMVYSEDNINEVGAIKITWVGQQEASGRILRGDMNELIGKPARETFDTQKDINTARIEQKQGANVIINAGKDLGIEKGDVFKVIKTTKVNAGSLVINQREELGQIYITKVHKEYSEGRIFKGVNKVEAGLNVVEVTGDDKRTRRPFFRIGYKTTFGKTIRATPAAGNENVSNNVNSYLIDTYYLNDFNDIKKIDVYTFAFGTTNLVKNLTTAIQADIYNMGTLHNWIAHLDILYNCTIIPESFYWSIGPAMGYGRIKQQVPNGVVQYISEGQSQDLRASSIYLALNTNFNVQLGRVVLTAGVTFDYLNYNTWNYNTSNMTAKNGSAAAPHEIIPYANVNLGGAYFSGGLSYYLNR